MNTETDPDQKPPLIKVTKPEVAPPKGRLHIPHLLGWLFAGFAAFVLAGLGLPTGGGVQIKGAQTKALAQAKQIALALRLFAADHDGHYPSAGIPEEMTNAPADANMAFAPLFPTYLESETIFGNKLSVYQTALPDNVIDKPYIGTPKDTLQPGENVYSYVMGLTDRDDPHTPLIADGTDGTGHYNTNHKKRGGVWEGKKAIIIWLDDSGTLETLDGPDDARFVPKPGDPASNLLDFSHSGKDLRLLDPAVGPRRK